MNLNLFKKILLAFYIPIAANLVLITYFMYQNLLFSNTVFQLTSVILLFLAIVFICWMLLNILPNKADKQIGLRLSVMMGGRTLCYCALYGFSAQICILLLLYPQISRLYHNSILWGNTAYAVVIYFILLWNGIIRIFCTSRRLSIKMRILMILAMWIPVINLLVLLHALNLVYEEYDFACYKASVHHTRIESDICNTHYPLIMVHGVGFRDLRYFNYWGRIPKELTRYGATIYYGNQEAFGTISANAKDIRKEILKVLEETGCGKVNIIAHSKGGLDSRYAISKLGMDKFVASLTTICTPHHGCRFVDYACRLPDTLYRMIARHFDRAFTKFGDSKPDFYTATHQFTTYESRIFNQEVPDSPLVYYQSYATKMKDCFSDPLLSVSYCLIKPLEGDNDGLVSIESAKWGHYKGVISSSHHRGISHGDIIDLKREDYKGFDVVERFVQIVSQLKEDGF